MIDNIQKNAEKFLAKQRSPSSQNSVQSFCKVLGSGLRMF